MLPLDDQWYVYRYKIRRGKGMTARELQRYVQSIMNKRAYLDEVTTDEELTQRKKEAKKRFYDIKTLSKISLAKLKDEIEPYSLGQQRQIRKLMKRFDRTNKKSFFFKICDVEGLGVLEFGIPVENLVRLLKMKENDAFDLGVGSVVIRSYPIENMWIDEKDKLEPYGWTMENGKIIKKGKRTKDVEIEEFLKRSPRFQLMKIIEKEKKKRKRILSKKRKEEQRCHWVQVGDKTYKVPTEELSEFNKAAKLGNVLVLKKYEYPLSQKKGTGHACITTWVLEWRFMLPTNVTQATSLKLA